MLPDLVDMYQSAMEAWMGEEPHDDTESSPVRREIDYVDDIEF
ncbi:MAG: hypothetical protein RR420_05365 [Anaerovoracaceae bacterium]